MGGWVGPGCMVVVMRRGRRQGGCGGDFGLSLWGCWGGLCGRRFGGREAVEVVVVRGGEAMAVVGEGEGEGVMTPRRRTAGSRRSRRRCRGRGRRGGDRGFGAG